MAIKQKLLNLISAGNEVTGNDDTNITDVIQALIDGYGGVRKLYSHYMSHISPINGYYDSHPYDAVFLKDGFLYVFYTRAPHHYTDKTSPTTSLMLCKYDTTTKTVVSNTVVISPARCFWHGVAVGGTYYLFAESGTKYRLATTDFVNFTEASWSAPSSFSNMNYIIVVANNRLICTTGRTAKGMNIFYSDDLGLTWTKAAGYADAVTTHGGFVHLGGGKVVLYCQDSYTGGTDNTTNSHDTKRAVLVSEDNGETWSGKLCANSDLVDCGITYSSGSFCKIGEDWYFGTSRRLIERQNGGTGTYTLGDIRLFKGSESDVINGAMQLYKTVDLFDTGATETVISKSTIQSDSGNMSMVTDGTHLYLVYHKQLLHSDVNKYGESNSAVYLAIVDNNKLGDVSDDYYNSNWQNDMEAFVSAKSKTYDLYAYGEDHNFATGIYTHADNQYVFESDIVPSDVLEIPYVDEFEVIAVVIMSNRLIDSTWADQYIGAGIGNDVHVYGGVTNIYRLNNTQSGGGCVFSSQNNIYSYFKLKYENGVISATLNGRTVNDLRCPEQISKRNITDKKIVMTLGDMNSLLPTLSGNATIKGFKALAINTDGDIHNIRGYTVTYNGENCTFSNNSTLVSGAYTCTVTPNSGYELTALSYTMGGVTYSVSGDTISINNVTDPLVINATVEALEYELTTDGLVAWYDVGDSENIDSSGIVTSDIANSYTAWTGSPAMSNRISQAIKPTVYNSGYCGSNGAMQIYFGDAISNIGNTITLEYLFADNYGKFSAGINAGVKNSTSASVGNKWSISYLGGIPSIRTFSHVVVVLSSSGAIKLYVNNILKKENISLTDCMTVTAIGIGGGATSFIGHVRVYNKELTASEINSNYMYFASNCKAGQAAYDSSGNFVGW
jgi:hypothetical protein